MLDLLAVFLAALACAVVIRAIRYRQWSASLPPGPPSHPIWGHLCTIPTPQEFPETLYEWSRTYGDVIHLEALGTHIIVLNSEKAASELLDKRSGNYSDRPPFPIYHRLGWQDILVFMPYGQAFLQQRKSFQQALSRTAVLEYAPIQELETNLFLKQLLETPEQFERHAHRLSTAIIVNMAYGHHIATCDDEYYVMCEKFEHLLRQGAQPTLLDIHPIFERLPNWFPGAGFKRFIQEWRPFCLKFIEYPVLKVQEQMNAGSAKLSFTAQHIEAMSREGRKGDERLIELQNITHQLIGAGGETTWHTILVFIACMLKNPHVQTKAQREIDERVGRDRLPDLNDRDSLPYLECVVKETMRWHPVLPLDIPHRSLEDDHYEEMFIPKGATVIANARAITWDENIFYEPRLFKPERFLPKPEGRGEVFPQGAVFGWGRRACLGRYFADNSQWLIIARTLAVFNIERDFDALGRPIDPEITFIQGFFSFPKSFPCKIAPRDARAAKLIDELDCETPSSSL